MAQSTVADGADAAQSTPGSLLERLAQLEAGVQRAAEVITRLRGENERLNQERRQVLGQVESILRDLASLDMGP